MILEKRCLFWYSHPPRSCKRPQNNQMATGLRSSSGLDARQREKGASAVSALPPLAGAKALTSTLLVLASFLNLLFEILAFYWYIYFMAYIKSCIKK